jgi:hypothetical protein
MRNSSPEILRAYREAAVLREHGARSMAVASGRNF